MEQLVDCRALPGATYKSVHCEDYTQAPETTTPTVITPTEPCGVYEVCQIAQMFNDALKCSLPLASIVALLSLLIA